MTASPRLRMRRPASILRSSTLYIAVDWLDSGNAMNPTDSMGHHMLVFPAGKTLQGPFPIPDGHPKGFLTRFTHIWPTFTRDLANLHARLDRAP